MVDSSLLNSVKDKALIVGKKTIMDLLAKSFHNVEIKGLVEVLIDIMRQDPSICVTFLQ
jgi:hypothetical protein